MEQPSIMLAPSSHWVVHYCLRILGQMGSSLDHPGIFWTSFLRLSMDALLHNNFLVPLSSVFCVSHKFNPMNMFSLLSFHSYCLKILNRNVKEWWYYCLKDCNVMWLMAMFVTGERGERAGCLVSRFQNYFYFRKTPTSPCSHVCS